MGKDVSKMPKNRRISATSNGSCSPEEMRTKRKRHTAAAADSADNLQPVPHTQNSAQPIGAQQLPSTTPSSTAQLDSTGALQQSQDLGQSVHQVMNKQLKQSNAQPKQNDQLITEEQMKQLVAQMLWQQPPLTTDLGGQQAQLEQHLQHQTEQKPQPLLAEPQPQHQQQQQEPPVRPQPSGAEGNTGEGTGDSAAATRPASGEQQDGASPGAGDFEEMVMFFSVKQGVSPELAREALTKCKGDVDEAQIHLVSIVEKSRLIKENIVLLVSNGVAQDKAEEALNATEGDIDRAQEYLLGIRDDQAEEEGVSAEEEERRAAEREAEITANEEELKQAQEASLNSHKAELAKEEDRRKQAAREDPVNMYPNSEFLQ
ncbi:hypothetical protein CYMTET_35048, partial [Cymbomonas tetramitiformis]